MPVRAVPGADAPAGPGTRRATSGCTSPCSTSRRSPRIGAGEIEQITGLVRERCAGIAPFAVTAGRAEAWHTGVVCPIRPGPSLRHLWHVTTTTADQVTAGAWETRPRVYYPHLTLAYAHDHVDHGPLRAWISDSSAAEVALPVTRLALVAQQHDRREITFRLIDEVPLTGRTT